MTFEKDSTLFSLFSETAAQRHWAVETAVGLDAVEEMDAGMEVKSTEATCYREPDPVLHSTPLYLRIFSN